MNVFINLISKPGIIFLFEGNRKIINEITWNSSMNEFDTLLENLSELLEKNNLKYEEISEIHTVNGPGGFTGTRTTALVINTIKYLNKSIKLFSYNFFELAEISGANYPMMIKANKREYLIKNSTKENPEIKRIEEIGENTYFGIGDLSDFENKNIKIENELNYNKFLEKTKIIEIEKIEPYYIKEPNITC